MPAKSRWI